MIERGGQERLAPMLMTALTAGIALVPLALAAGEPGKEILYPVATVIVGGLISSTLLDFFVHPALFWTLGLASATARSSRTIATSILMRLEASKRRPPFTGHRSPPAGPSADLTNRPRALH